MIAERVKRKAFHAGLGAADFGGTVDEALTGGDGNDGLRQKTERGPQERGGRIPGPMLCRVRSTDEDLSDRRPP
jgi:hypothetical protein